MKQKEVKTLNDWHTRQCYLILKQVHGQEYAESAMDTSPFVLERNEKATANAGNTRAINGMVVPLF